MIDNKHDRIEQIFSVPPTLENNNKVVGDTTGQRSLLHNMLAYHVTPVLKGLQATLPLASAVMLAVFVTATLIGTSVLVQTGVNNALIRWRDGVETIIFLEPHVTQDVAADIGAQLSQNPLVERFYYVNTEETYTEFRQLFHDSPELLEGVTPQSLPTSWRVTPKAGSTLTDIETIGETFKTQPGVYSVSYASAAVQSVFNIAKLVSFILGAIATIVGITTVLMLWAATKASVAARAQEVAVMRSVGASRIAIRTPFITEGVLVASLGALGAIAVTRLTINILEQVTRNLSGDLVLLSTFRVTPPQFWWTVGPISVTIITLAAGVTWAATNSFVTDRHQRIPVYRYRRQQNTK